MLPFNSWFCTFFLQIPDVVVYQLAMVILDTLPADQLGLSEVCYEPSIHFSIHCGAPLIVGLQVNQPYFMIVSVRHHNLLWTDYRNKNTPKIFTFHSLPKQGFSVAVSVEKNRTILSNILSVLLSLLLDQKQECIVEGSERIANT